MAKSVRLVINVRGFNALRNGDEVVGLMESLASSIKARADLEIVHKSYPDQEAFVVATVHNPTRAVTFVRTQSEDGKVAEAANRTLTRAFG